MKRKMSENSLKNLKPLSERTLSERKEIAKKGAAVTNKIKAEKIKRLEANDYLWDRFYTPEALGELWERLSPKEKLDLLKALLPKDKQDFNLLGEIEVQKVFITEKEQKEIEDHINQVINEQ